MTDTVQEGTPRTRRALLTAAAGGAAALAVSAIKPGAASAGVAVPMNIETDNVATAPTGLTNTDAGEKTLIVQASGDGTALETNTVSGVAVLGRSADTSDPETNVRNAGLVGVAGSTGNMSDNFGLTGVYGVADASPDPDFVGSGVWGASDDIGVAGTGGIGVFASGTWGVYGTSDPSGLALFADGRAAFARSGRTEIKAGNAKKVVSLAGVTSSSLVFAVLAQSRSGRYVRAVVPESGQFTIRLNQSVSKDTKVSWIVFTNPSNLSG